MTDRLEKLNRYHQERYGDRSVAGLNKSARLRAELFAGWVGTGKRLLEIGAGPGPCWSSTPRATASPGSTSTSRRSRSAAGASAWRRCGRTFPTHLPFAGDAFDVVVAGETLEHMPYPAIVLEEIRRVLVPGGLCVGSVPNAYHYKNRLAVLRGRPIDDDPTHMQFYSLASLRALLARAVTVEEIAPVRRKFSRRFPLLFAHNLAFRCRRADQA